SEQLAEPYVMLGFNAIVADTDEEAQLLATSVQQAFVSLRTGKPVQLPPPKRGYADELPLEARAILRSVLSASAIGSPATARRQLMEFVGRTRPDELMVTSQVYDHPARVKSFELLMEAVPQPSTALAK
ncbi:MAG: alkane 1-monooxygenase, partial [Sphingomicrobium sp.]